VKKVSLLALTALVVALAVPTLASNTGFKLNHDLAAGGANLVSFPYFYFPSGDITDTDQTGIELCADLATGGCDITSITKIDKSSGTPLALPQPCPGVVSRFSVRAGEAYFVTVPAACTIDVVGSHDNEASVGGGSPVTLTTGSNPVSVPYHVQADTSKDLCDHLIADNGLTTELVSISRIDPVLRVAVPQPCPAIVSRFSVTPGEGYFFTVGVPSLDILWRTY
jgi:hypothetical protein